MSPITSASRKHSNMILSSIFFVFLFSFSSKCAVAQGNPPCGDDPFFGFGTYMRRGERVTRTCKWLAEKQSRKDKWCYRKVADYLPIILVGKKCPDACGGEFACPRVPLKSNCMDYPRGWHDRTDKEYNCQWFKRKGESN